MSATHDTGPSTAGPRGRTRVQQAAFVVGAAVGSGDEPHAENTSAALNSAARRIISGAGGAPAA